MTHQDDEFDMLLRHHRTLTPEQHDLLVRRAVERAKAYRAEAIRSLFRRLFGWIRRRAAVARLQALDDRTLKDIGINRCEIEAIVRDPERPPREPLPGLASVTALNPARPPASRGTRADASNGAPHGRVGRAA